MKTTILLIGNNRHPDLEDLAVIADWLGTELSTRLVATEDGEHLAEVLDHVAEAIRSAGGDDDADELVEPLRDFTPDAVIEGMRKRTGADLSSSDDVD